jgi:hypothetical protein
MTFFSLRTAKFAGLMAVALTAAPAVASADDGPLQNCARAPQQYDASQQARWTAGCVSFRAAYTQARQKANAEAKRLAAAADAARDAARDACSRDTVTKKQKKGDSCAALRKAASVQLRSVEQEVRAVRQEQDVTIRNARKTFETLNRQLLAEYKAARRS